MLTPEQLDMLKRLQPFFREKRGEDKVGDRVFSPILGLGCIVNTSHPSMIKVIFDDAKPFTQEWFYKSIDLLRIPKVIDWQNPERGLWGMIVDVEWKSFVERGQGCRYSDNLREIYSEDLFTALLKALCEQEGV